MRRAFAFADINDGREFMDSLVFNPVRPSTTRTLPEPDGPRGDWFEPEVIVPGRTLLYLHGGGYAFHAESHADMIRLIAEAVRARTFAADYRLAPEHPHPAQLEDALAAYRWLLERGADPKRLIVAGDSAGGHLSLMLMQELRRAGLPQPALVAGLCPWTDIGERGASFFGNDRTDWVQGFMALKYGEWYRGDTGLSREALSPIHGDYRGLAPIYLQAGGREVLVDQIREFADVVRAQGAAVQLDVWDEMTHDFQAYGDFLPESREALTRLGQEADRFTR
jgi:acetyl esterase/lipase